MATFDFIRYAFAAGELSPTLYGRSDLDKFDLGLARAENCFVDYRGGVSNRPGTHFIDFVEHDDLPTKYFPFIFDPVAFDSLVLLFGHEYVAFIQNGSYLFDSTSSQNVTNISATNPAIATVAGHGLAEGDVVRFDTSDTIPELEGSTFLIGATTLDTFAIMGSHTVGFDGTDISFSSATVEPILKLSTPYAASDLTRLRAHQNKNLVRLTHIDYSIHDLIRDDEGDWTLTEAEIGATTPAPDNLASNPSSSGSAGMMWVVTAIGSGGEESVGSIPHIETESVDYTSTAGSLKLTWDPVMGASSYNIYRSLLLADGDDVSQAMSVGYVGTSFGPEFVDNNIVPDFTVTPPQHVDPFADSTITFIEMTNGGSGYNKDATATITDPDGSGFVGYPIVDDSGVILGVVIVNGGSGYTDPTVVFAGGGSSAAADAEVGPADGNKPGVSTTFQQRQEYAGSRNQPLTLWGSRPRLIDNFDVARVVIDSDSYEYDIDSTQASRLEHLVPMRAGMLVMSPGGVWQFTGGEAVAVTPLNALGEPQTATGAANVEPLRIDTDVYYVENKGFTVRLLTFNELAKVFQGRDISILSNHLFGMTRQILRWAWAQAPHKLIWSVRSDGALLALTTVQEQEVFAWTRNFTKGLFEDVVTVQEGNIDRTYVMVKRLLNGRWTKTIELIDDRTFEHVENAWFVDCGLELPQIFPDANLTASAPSGTATFTADAAVFEAGDVGKVLRVGGGKATIETFNSSTEVEGTFAREMTAVVPEGGEDTPLVALSGSWTLDPFVTQLSGLWHLEGETLSILADGSVAPEVTVSDGMLTLQDPASRVIVGLPYSMRLRTLPLTEPSAIIEGRRKRVVALVSRLNESRGLRMGAKESKLYELKERTTEPPGEPIVLIDGMRHILVSTPFEREGATYFQQDYPLPTTLLSVVIDAEVGDDKD